MKFSFDSLSLLVCLFLSACTPIVSKKLVGEKPVKLDAAKWNGAWQDSDEQIVYAHVADADHGELDLASVDSEKGRFILKTGKAFIRESGDQAFLNTTSDRDVSSSEKKGYTVFPISAEEQGQIILWAFSEEKVAKLVESGALKGKIVKEKDSNAIVLDELSNADLELLRAPANFDAIVWSHPLVWHRIGSK